jgi:hypothetical protein
MTQLAVILVGIWLILQSQTNVSSTLTVIFGIAVCVLALLDLMSWRTLIARRAP